MSLPLGRVTTDGGAAAAIVAVVVVVVAVKAVHRSEVCQLSCSALPQCALWPVSRVRHSKMKDMLSWGELCIY